MDVFRMHDDTTKCFLQSACLDYTSPAIVFYAINIPKVSLYSNNDYRIYSEPIDCPRDQTAVLPPDDHFALMCKCRLKVKPLSSEYIYNE
jgi:hypothetical protein